MIDFVVEQIPTPNAGEPAGIQGGGGEGAGISAA